MIRICAAIPRSIVRLSTPGIGILSGSLAVGIQVAIRSDATRAAGWLAVLAIVASSITMIAALRAMID